jgi:uncharacterized protein
MRYNVAQLLKEPTGSTRSYQLWEEFSDAERIVDSARGTVDMLRTHQGVLVNATLEIQDTITCGRCLGETGLDSGLSIEEEFLPISDLPTGLRQELPEDEGYGQIDANHDLDLTEVLRQYVITQRPMKPLCRPDCQGLCQICGGNLNEKQCGCRHESSDSLEGTLAQLLPRD